MDDVQVLEKVVKILKQCELSGLLYSFLHVNPPNENFAGFISSYFMTLHNSFLVS